MSAVSTPWSQDEDNELLTKVPLATQNPNWETVSLSTGRGWIQCLQRWSQLQQEVRQGNYYAFIDEICSGQNAYEVRETEWATIQRQVCRQGPPDFARIQLGGDRRAPNEFVFTRDGARLTETDDRDSTTTVNNNLLPFDIFGRASSSAQKAHLLPKERNPALSWYFPACAVLGLSTEPSRKSTVQKAILGCRHRIHHTKYPGIRNLLCNIIKLENQASQFDQNPYVVILPICDLRQMREWSGQGYDAIVLCDSAEVVQSVSMNNANNFQEAALEEINKSLTLASVVCKFLAHSVVQKAKNGRNDLQDIQESLLQKSKLRDFVQSKRCNIPQVLSQQPAKPVFKITFVGHDPNAERGEKYHPAPDPMLLAFKSCNNLCRRKNGFRMVGGGEYEDLDELSEDGQKNLNDYLQWQAEEMKKMKHDEIMERFGGNGFIDAS